MISPGRAERRGHFLRKGIEIPVKFCYNDSVYPKKSGDEYYERKQ